MSEYRWYVRRMWIGVEFQLADPSWPLKHDPYYQRELVGVIRRSGWVQAVGHFCHTHVSYLGKKRYAANAEARIFPFHSLQLEPGELPKKLKLVWLGWCTNKSTLAFVNKHCRVVEITGAGVNFPNTEEIPAEVWPNEWRRRGFLEGMWEAQGMVRVEQEYDRLVRKAKARRLQDEMLHRDDQDG